MKIAHVQYARHGHSAGADSPIPSTRPNRTFMHWSA
jgi:hypothetical protein